MAYLKRVKKTYENHITYHYYSLVKNDSVWLKPKLISLNTTDVKDARKRHQEVEDNEKAIKGGDELEYTWNNPQNRGRTRIKKICLGVLTDQWLANKKINVREGTLDRYRVSLNAFINVMGRTCPMSAINNKSIEDFKKFYDGKHTKGGIDINLRGIKSFLLWALEEGHIKKMPKIVQFNVKTPPKYINELNWKKLMSVDVGQYWKNGWRLYRDLGCRLKEIIMGSIDGDFLIVGAKDTKSKKELEIPITPNQKGIIQAIHTRRDEHLSDGYKIKNFTDRYSKVFHRSCKKVGLDFNFHCLRHTFAVRKYIETRDIMMVSKMLFHEELSTTQIYSKFNIYRLEQEFPSLVYSNVVKEGKKKDLETTKVETINYQFLTSPLKN